MKQTISGLVALILLAATHAPRAETLELAIQSWTTISDGSGNQRVLVGFGDSTGLAGRRVLYAKLTFHVEADTCVDGLWDIGVIPIATYWSETNVSWESPWDSAGGDVAPILEQDIVSRSGESQHLEVILTQVAQAWSVGALGQYGLLLVPRDSPCVMTLSADATYPGKGFGVMYVRMQETGE